MTSLPNAFEIAVLQRMAQGVPALRSIITNLRVLRRELTGAGSYTHFAPTPTLAIADGYIGLDSLILMPGVPNGMGAALAVTSGCPDFLEVFTYGEDSWDGSYSGFAIHDGGA